jgi:DNA-binding IclR family transcriptional regulator
MECLRNETRGTIILSQLKDDQIVIIESLPGTDPIKITFKPGQRNHFNFGAAGAVLCAFMNQDHLKQLVAQKGLCKFTSMTVSNEETFFQHLSEVRANEIAISDEAAIKGARAIAVPIYQKGDKVIAALSIAFPSGNCTRKQLLEISDALKGASRAIFSFPLKTN